MTSTKKLRLTPNGLQNRTRQIDILKKNKRTILKIEKKMTKQTLEDVREIMDELSTLSEQELEENKTVVDDILNQVNNILSGNQQPPEQKINVQEELQKQQVIKDVEHFNSKY